MSTIVGWGYSTELDIVRNVLLFTPLGLALALSRSAPISTVRFTMFVLASSFSLAYALELFQGLMPSRFPSLVDVFANAAGALLGAALMRCWQRGQIEGLTWVYAVSVCALAVPLHAGARLDTWDPSFPFVLANEATGDRPWSGVLRQVCFVDQVLGFNTAEATASPCDIVPTDAFVWTDRLDSTGGEWRLSAAEGAAVNTYIMKASAFTVLATFDSHDPGQRGPARIVSLSKNPELRNFTLAQQDTALVARLRTRATNTNGTARELRVEGGLERPGRHVAMFTYDGARQCLSIDTYPPACADLAPGIVAAAALDRRLAPFGPVSAWNAAYYAALFLPLGVLMHLAARAMPLSVGTVLLRLAFCAVALEAASALVPGRPLRSSAIAISLAWGAVGAFVPWFVRTGDGSTALRERAAAWQ
jgi:hypothetical protein